MFWSGILPHRVVHDLGHGGVGRLEIVKDGPAAAQMELGGLPHQAELGVQIRLLLAVGEGVPVSVSTMTRRGVFLG